MGKTGISWLLFFLFLWIYLATETPRSIFCGLHLSSSKLWMSLKVVQILRMMVGAITLVMQAKLWYISKFSLEQCSQKDFMTVWYCSEVCQETIRPTYDRLLERGTDCRGHCNYIQKLASLQDRCSPRDGGPATVRAQIRQWPQNVYSLSHPEVLAPGILRRLPERETKFS